MATVTRSERSKPWFELIRFQHNLTHKLRYFYSFQIFLKPKKQISLLIWVDFNQALRRGKTIKILCLSKAVLVPELGRV